MFFDGILLCLFCSFLGFCASNIPRIVWGSFALLVLGEMMWLLYFTLFASDTSFRCDFLNAVGSLTGYSVSSLVVSGLYLRVMNFLNLCWCRCFVFASFVLMVSSIWKCFSFAVTFFRSAQFLWYFIWFVQ